MVRKVTTILLISGSLMMAACNTVRGAGEDLGSAANATENAINKESVAIDRQMPRQLRLAGFFVGGRGLMKKAPPASADGADFQTW